MMFRPLKLEMQTRIAIDASPDQVWGVLTALRSYCEWNPAIIAASGDVRVGARLTLRFQPIGARGYTFRPKLLVVEPARELRWMGWPRVPLVFDTEHYFAIAPVGERASLVVHGLLAYGFGAPLAARTIDRVTRRHFDQMNLALKERTETMDGGGDAQ
jgi:hypothetical protein